MNDYEALLEVERILGIEPNTKYFYEMMKSYKEQGRSKEFIKVYKYVLDSIYKNETGEELVKIDKMYGELLRQ